MINTLTTKITNCISLYDDVVTKVFLKNPLLNLYTVHTLHNKKFNCKLIKKQLCIFIDEPISNCDPVSFMGDIEIKKFLNSQYCDINHINHDVIVL